MINDGRVLPPETGGKPSRMVFLYRGFVVKSRTG